jgi:surfeit locus 1 family protein
MTARRRLWPVLLATTIAFSILISLGLWQLQRLKWKTALLAEIEARQSAAPIVLAALELQRAPGENIEFMKVTARGHFLHDQEKLMLSTLDGRAAWDVVTPLVTLEQKVLLVDRGAVPDDHRDAATRRDANPEGEVEVTGILKTHAAPRTFFSPDNNAAANQWIWWDMPALAAATRLPAGATLLPYVLHVTPGGVAFPPIEAKPPTSGISNNHLQYVITWFGLALALLAVAAIYVRGLMNKSDA